MFNKIQKQREENVYKESIYLVYLWSIQVFVGVIWLLEDTIFSHLQVLLAPTGAIFKEANNEMTNTMMRHIHLYKELKKKIAGGLYQRKEFY